MGKNLMDHPFYVPGRCSGGSLPLSRTAIDLRNRRLRDGAFRTERAAYRIEIGNEGWNFAIGGVPNITTLDLVNGLNQSQTNPKKEAMFGDNLVEHLNNIITRQFRLGFLIEQSPEERNRVELSADHKDHLNLPRPQVSYDLSDYTKAGVAAASKRPTKFSRGWERHSSQRNLMRTTHPRSNGRSRAIPFGCRTSEQATLWERTEWVRTARGRW